MNAQDYTIVVQKSDIEGERLFEITVVEFPDVVVYDEDLKEAYSIAMDTITGLIEMAAEMGHQVPRPVDNTSKEYSGKITFRPGRKLHHEIAEAADRDGVSLNQWLCFAATTSTTSGGALTVIREEIASALAHLSPTYVQVVSGSVTERSAHGAAYASPVGSWSRSHSFDACLDTTDDQAQGFVAVASDTMPTLCQGQRKSSAIR